MATRAEVEALVEKVVAILLADGQVETQHLRDKSVTKPKLAFRIPPPIPFILQDPEDPIEPAPMGGGGGGGPGTPGAPGADGADGKDGISYPILDPEDPEPWIPLPGQRGQKGNQGDDGTPGLPGTNGKDGISYPILDPEEPELPLYMPGRRGATGATGATGPVGSGAQARSIWIPADAMGGITGATLTNFGSGADIVRVREFAAATDDAASFSFVVPQDWATGTPITFVVVWAPSNTDTGNARFILGASELVTGDNIATEAVSSSTVLDAGAGVTNGKQSLTFLELFAPTATGSSIKGTLQRTGTNVADTLTGSSRVHGVVLRYTANTGSSFVDEQAYDPGDDLFVTDGHFRVWGDRLEIGSTRSVDIQGDGVLVIV